MGRLGDTKNEPRQKDKRRTEKRRTQSGTQNDRRDGKCARLHCKQGWGQTSERKKRKKNAHRLQDRLCGVYGIFSLFLFSLEQISVHHIVSHTPQPSSLWCPSCSKCFFRAYGHSCDAFACWRRTKHAFAIRIARRSTRFFPVDPQKLRAISRFPKKAHL